MGHCASWAALPILTGGQKKLPPQSSSRSIEKVSFSSDGHFLAGITSRGVVLTWQLDGKGRDPLEQSTPDTLVLDFGFLPKTHRISILSLSAGTAHANPGTGEAWQLDYDTGNRTGPLEAPSQMFESKTVWNGKHLKLPVPAYASAGKWLLESPGVVDLYDAQSSKHLGQASTGRVEGGETIGIVISQNGTRMALGSKNGPIDFIDLKTGSILRHSKLYVSMSAKLVSSADDRSLAILGTNFLNESVTFLDRFGSDPMNSLNGGCTASDVASGCVLRSEPAELTAAAVILPNSSLPASTPRGLIGVLTTDLQTGKVKPIPGPLGISSWVDQVWQKDVTLARFSSDGHWLALGRLSSDSPGLGISGVPTKNRAPQQTPLEFEFGSSMRLGSHPAYTIKMPELNALALSPTGRYPAAETSSGVVKTWELTTDGVKELWTGTTNNATAAPSSGQTTATDEDLKTPTWCSLVFSQDGQWLAEAVSGNGVRIWKSDDGNEKTIPLGSSCGVGTIAFMGDDALAVSCWSSSDIRILDRGLGRETEKLKAQASVPIDIAYFGNRKLILSTTTAGFTLLSGSDGKQTTWDVYLAVSLTQGDASAGDSQWLAVTPEGLFDGTADAMEWVAWRVEGSNKIVPVGDFFNDYYEPGLLSEIMEGANPKPILDVASVLQIPGLRAMLRDKSDPPPVSLLKIGDGAYACFQQEPTALHPVNVDPVRCKYGVRLPYSGQPDELITALNRPSDPYKNAWENKKAGNTSTSTLHVLTVAIDHTMASPSQFHPRHPQQTNWKDSSTGSGPRATSSLLRFASGTIHHFGMAMLPFRRFENGSEIWPNR